MPADLRTKLQALVEEWRKLSGSEEGVTRFRWLIAPFGSRHLCTDAGREVGAGLKECADQLAALLAESEPEEPRDNAHQLAARLVAQAMHGTKLPPGYTQQRPGCGRDHGGGSWNANCPDCEAKATCTCEVRGSIRYGDRCPACEAKAKLPLGHEFVQHSRQAWADRCGVIVQMCGTDQPMFRVVCGQPRSAHEVK